MSDEASVMSKIFNNPFKRREREQERLKQEAAVRERSRQPSTSSAPPPRQGAIPRRQLTPPECLNAINGLLQQIRAMSPNDIHAFPLLNQSQRLVQDLREAVHIYVPTNEKHVWVFQIQELQDEVQSQTDRIVSSAASRPGPKPAVRAAAPMQALGGMAGQAHAQAGSLRQSSGDRASSSSYTLPTSTPYLSTPSRPQLQRPMKNNVPPAHAALQSALFPSQAPSVGPGARADAGGAAAAAAQLSTLSSAFAAATLLPVSSTGRTAPQSPVRAGVQPAASSTRTDDDMFSGLSVAEPSPSGRTTQLLGPSMSDSAGFPGSSPPTLPAPSLLSTSSAALSAAAHRRGSSWSTDLGPALGPSSDPVSYGGLEGLDPVAKKSMKKKTRGVKVGYGTQEDPRAPSTPASPGSFTAASLSSLAAAAQPGPLTREGSSMSGSAAPASKAQPDASPEGAAAATPPRQQQEQQGLLQRQQQQQQQGAGSSHPPDKPTAVAAAAARRLNLPAAGGYARSTTAAPCASRPYLPNGAPGYGARPPSAPPHAQSTGHAASAVEAAAVSGISLISWASHSTEMDKATLGLTDSSGMHSPAELLAQQLGGAGFPGQHAGAAASSAAQGWEAASSSSAGAGALLAQQSGDFASHAHQQLPSSCPAAAHQQLPSSLFLVSPRAPASTSSPPGSAAARVEVYLDSLAGPLAACHQAATAAASEVAQQLAAASAALQQQEEATRAAQQARLADLATCSEATAVLERQQQAAADREDYDAAAALDERLQQVAAQAGAVDAAATQLEAAAAQLRAQRVEMQEQQGQVWDVAAAYLRRLRDGQAAAAAAAAAALAHELDGLGVQHGQAERAIAEAEAALGVRRAELAEARRDVEAKVLGATWPLQAEKERLSTQEAQLDARVRQLREELALREQQLLETSSQLAQAQGQITALSAPFAPQLAALGASEAQLQAQEQGLQQQVQVVRRHCAQAEQRRQAAQQQQQLMEAQAQALTDAAAALAARAAQARRQPGAGEGGDEEQRQALSPEEARAQEKLQGLSKSIEELGLQVEALASRAAVLEAEASEAQARVDHLSGSLPALEAAKKAAAACKDFKEAARLSSESKQAQLQVDSLTQQAAQAQAALRQLHAQRTAKAAELEGMKAMLPQLQGEVANVRRRSLIQLIEQTQLMMNQAAAEERYEDAQQLQGELNAAVAEAAGLAEALERSTKAEEQQHVDRQAGSTVASPEAGGGAGSPAPGVDGSVKVDAGRLLGSTASSCSSSMDRRTVVVHGPSEERGHDSAEAEAAAAALTSSSGVGLGPAAAGAGMEAWADTDTAAAAEAGRVRGGEPSGSTHGGGALPLGAGGQTADSQSSATARSAWRSNDLFDSEVMAAGEPTPAAEYLVAVGKQTTDPDSQLQLPTRATAEQMYASSGPGSKPLT